MTAPASLPIDLADPNDIRSKLPQAERMLESMERELAEQEKEIERWRRLVGVLRSVTGASQGEAPSPPKPTPAAKQGQMQDLVVDAVNRVGHDIRSRDVRKMLVEEGHEVSAESVSNALWYAAERLKTIRRGKGRGVYGPLAEPETDEHDEEAENPFLRLKSGDQA